eukprot:gene5623-197_t
MPHAMENSDSIAVGSKPSSPKACSPASERTLHTSSDADHSQFVNSTLWMGDLERGTTQATVTKAFETYGFKPTLVRIIRKSTKGRELSAGYCFVTFSTVEEARQALTELNGEPIPETKPIRVFFLNWASQHQKASIFSVYIGRLPPFVDSNQLMKFFKQHFSSCHGAKIIYDITGSVSRCFGFLRFSNEEDSERCIQQFNKAKVFGKTISLSIAFPTRIFWYFIFVAIHQGDMYGPNDFLQSPLSHYPYNTPGVGMTAPYQPMYAPTQAWSLFSLDSFNSTQTPYSYSVPLVSPADPLGLSTLTDQFARHSLSPMVQSPQAGTVFIYPPHPSLAMNTATVQPFPSLSTADSILPLLPNDLSVVLASTSSSGPVPICANKSINLKRWENSQPTRGVAGPNSNSLSISHIIDIPKASI